MKNTCVTYHRINSTKGDLERLTLNLLDSVINIVDEMRRYASLHNIDWRDWIRDHSKSAYIEEGYRHAFALLDVVRATVEIDICDCEGLHDHSTEGLLEGMLTYGDDLDFHCSFYTLGFNSSITIWLEPRSNRQTDED